MKVDKEETQKVFEELVALCERLGWNVAIPEFDSSKESVDGLIIGTESFIKSIFEEVATLEEYKNESH